MPTDPTAGTDEPERYVIELPALKAMAHPLRIQLLAAIGEHGSATASQLAAELGESSGATSYHLRQLHRHGFIEEVPDRGTARERFWRTRSGGWELPIELMAQPSNAAAVNLVVREQLLADARRTMELLARAPELPAAWRDATRRVTTYLELSADQTKELLDELDALITKYKAMPAGPDAHRVATVFNVLPTDHAVAESGPDA
ncbi:winged helix-turn-helix domain-containing protein [Nakamurella aerolata]|uniref:Helix-turn-helix transcriptional regulator n=1 Tax=Nakamurella aerolata TaxID=1656892 RepID=A0A849A7X7_9ACTN|nr:helix-turn-helix domain-containing protein [Nakamurella aerolata]NNG34590.1 helix-turn-helix transcriptional regulator [Nakamurella aerolata]